MKFTIEFNSIDYLRSELKTLLTDLGVQVEAPAPAKKRASKAAEPVTGNPDAEPAVAPTAAPAVEAAAPKSLVADAPKEVARLVGVTDYTKALVADGILALSKDKGRAAAVSILEGFRPEGNTDPFVKVSAIDASRYADLAAKILEVYQG